MTDSAARAPLSPEDPALVYNSQAGSMVFACGIVFKVSSLPGLVAETLGTSVLWLYLFMSAVDIALLAAVFFFARSGADLIPSVRRAAAYRAVCAVMSAYLCLKGLLYFVYIVIFLTMDLFMGIDIYIVVLVLAPPVIYIAAKGWRALARISELLAPLLLLLIVTDLVFLQTDVDLGRHLPADLLSPREFFGEGLRYSLWLGDLFPLLFVRIKNKRLPHILIGSGLAYAVVVTVALLAVAMYGAALPYVYNMLIRISGFNLLSLEIGRMEWTALFVVVTMAMLGLALLLRGAGEASRRATGTPAPAFILFAAGTVACMFVPTLHTVADFCYSPAFGYAMFALALALAAAFAAFGAYAKSRRARALPRDRSRRRGDRPRGGAPVNSSRAKRTLTKLLSVKWAVLLVAAAVLLFFGRVTDARSLSRTAIVTGLGIAAGEDGFAVSAELAVMTSEAGGSPSANYAVLTEKGATVSEAVERISQKAGLIVSLSHCNVLVLTKEALLAEGERLFAPLVQTYSLPEQAILTSTTGDPADILSARLATASAPSFYIQQLLSEGLSTEGMPLVAVKDFAARLLSPSACVCLPVVEVREAEHQPQLPEGEGEGYSEIVAESGLVLTPSAGFIADGETVKMRSLVTEKEPSGRFCVTGEDGSRTEFLLLGASSSAKAEGLRVSVSAELKVSFVESTGEDGARLSPASDEIKRAADLLADELESAIRGLFALSVRQNADMLGLTDAVFKKLGRDTPEDCLGRIAFDCSVEVTVKENS